MGFLPTYFFKHMNNYGLRLEVFYRYELLNMEHYDRYL